MKNPNHRIGNRTRDLPAGSAVPESNAPFLTPRKYKISVTCDVAGKHSFLLSPLYPKICSTLIYTVSSLLFNCEIEVSPYDLS